jgi:putative molybdopterin biosynthesis protein
VLLVRGYNREQGLIVKHGNPKTIKGFQDLTREGIRFINRNRGSGTRLLINKHLSELAKAQKSELADLSKRVEGYDYEAKSHSAVAAAVKNDRADVGFGIKSVAVMSGLDFIKTDDEKYDFLVAKSHSSKPSVKAFTELIGTAEFSQTLRQRAPGLSATKDSGKVIFPT